AEVEDYFKAGRWQTEVMRMDIQAFHAHREEAGAPEPLALEELKLPPLPAEPVAVAPLAKPGAAVLTPPAPKVPSVQVSLPLAELQHLLKFVNEKNLNLSWAKGTLAPLPLKLRLKVMEGFEVKEGDPYKQLEDFIESQRAALAAEPEVREAPAPAGPLLTPPTPPPTPAPALAEALQAAKATPAKGGAAPAECKAPHMPAPRMPLGKAQVPQVVPVPQRAPSAGFGGPMRPPQVVPVPAKPQAPSAPQQPRAPHVVPVPKFATSKASASPMMMAPKRVQPMWPQPDAKRPRPPPAPAVPGPVRTWW
ncbi:unnamed protein product, partial [Effrenium voratum]